MDSDEESSKVCAELTPVMLENSDGERTEVKVPLRILTIFRIL